MIPILIVRILSLNCATKNNIQVYLSMQSLMEKYASNKMPPKLPSAIADVLFLCLYYSISIRDSIIQRGRFVSVHLRFHGYTCLFCVH